MNSRVSPAQVLGLVLALGLAVFIYGIEWVEEARNDGYSADALRNPYLAAEQFLDRFDIDVESRDGLALLDELPPTDHTVLIASSRRSLSERRVNDLIAWVSGGGRLIALATEIWDEDAESSGDLLLDWLGVRVMDPGDEPEVRAGTLARDVLGGLVNQGSCGSDRSLSRISLSDQDQDITASLGTWSHLRYEGAHEVSYAENAVGPQLLYLDVGDGAVVVVTSLGLWRNRQVHCHDNAHLLRWLADDRAKLWWLFNTEMPALPVMIWQRWPIAVLLLALWTALWIWRNGYRQQRIPAAGDAARRELVEHIDGVSRFYWQQNAGESLISGLRTAVLRGARPSERLVRELASRSGYSAERIRRALTGEPSKDPGSFLRTVRVLHDLQSSHHR